MSASKVNFRLRVAHKLTAEAIDAASTLTSAVRHRDNPRWRFIGDGTFPRFLAWVNKRIEKADRAVYFVRHLFSATGCQGENAHHSAHENAVKLANRIASIVGGNRSVSYQLIQQILELKPAINEELEAALQRRVVGEIPTAKIPPKTKKKPKSPGNPGLSKRKRTEMIREFEDYKVSGIRSKAEYLRSRGYFPNMDEKKSLAHLECCRKQWEKARSGK